MKNNNKKSAAKKRFSLRSIVYSRNGLLIISLLGAIVIWLAVYLNESPEVTRTIKDVPITIDESVPSQLGYKAYGAKDLYVDVTVKGKRYLVGDNVLSADDIVVTAVTTYVDSPGSYTLQLKATAKDSNASFTITAKSLDYVEVYFDTPATETFQINTELTYSADVVYSSDYISDTPVLSVNTVTVSGPSSEIDAISSVAAQAVCEGKLKSSKTYEATLSITDKHGNTFNYLTTDLGGKSLTVTVPVYKRTKLPTAVSFSNAPLSYVEKPLSYTMTPYSINAGIPEDSVNSTTAATIGTIDFSNINLGKNVYTFDTSKISGLMVIDDIDVITAVINISTDDYSSVVFDIPADKIKILNENSDFEVSVKSADISGITIIGPKADIAALTKDDITLSVNLENVTISKGNFNAVLTVSTGNDTCWAYGTYNAVLTAK